MFWCWSVPVSVSDYRAPPLYGCALRVLLILLICLPGIDHAGSAVRPCSATSTLEICLCTPPSLVLRAHASGISGAGPMFVKFNEVLRHAKGQREINNYGNVIHAILSGIVSLPPPCARHCFPSWFHTDDAILVMHAMIDERLHIADSSLISGGSNYCRV